MDYKTRSCAPNTAKDSLWNFKKYCHAAADGEEVTEESSSIEKKSVTFGIVQCRVYAVYVDDTPAVSHGPAIALSGWTYNEINPKSLDDYEKDRDPPRRLEDLKLFAFEREQILMDSGATKRELMECIKQANIARRKRAETIERSNHGLPEETMERILYSVKRLLRLKKSSKAEIQKLWKDASSSSNSSCHSSDLQ